MPKQRDLRFVAAHRGGPLALHEHRLLMGWACTCAKHVWCLLGATPDPGLEQALQVAQHWQQGQATVGQARQAAVKVFAIARNLTQPSAVAVARAVGHAVATAHMADHSLGAAHYALKAVQLHQGAVDQEREWQNQQLPPAIANLVLSARQHPRFAI